jgi:hypothetical protein
LEVKNAEPSEALLQAAIAKNDAFKKVDQSNDRNTLFENSEDVDRGTRLATGLLDSRQQTVANRFTD